MAKLLKLRRGTTTQHGSFTGEQGEVTVDTNKTTLVVHPGGTQGGGKALLREDLSNLPAGTIDNADISSSAAIANSKLATSGVTADTYGSSSAIPVITVNDRGIVTSATTSAIDSTSISNGTSNVSVAQNGDITATRGGTQRLAVTSIGIDVGGTVTCDGMTSDGDVTIQSGAGVLNLRDTNSTGDAAVNTINFQQSDSTTQGRVGYITPGNDDLHVYNDRSAQIIFGTSNQDRIIIQADGHMRPHTNNSFDLGTSSNQWRDAYFDGTVRTDNLTCDSSANFNHGAAGAITVAGNGDIRLGSGSNWTGESCKIQHHGNYLYIQGGVSGTIFRGNSGTDYARFDSAGNFRPATNNTYDLGTSTYRWRNVYTNDLNLSNEGGSNDVDGTWGSWTIQEGEDDLFLLNRRNGKKYKFNLTEVN